jgi:hypothetical protein
MMLIDEAEEQAAIQCRKSIWRRKGGDELVRKRGDKRSFGDHVNHEGILVIM